MSEIIESYFVNTKLYVSTKFLEAYFNRSDKQIGRWVKEGMTKANKPQEINKRGNYFILEEVIRWVSVNINKAKARNSKSDYSGLEDETEDERIKRELDIYEIYSRGTIKDKMKLMISLPRDTLENIQKMENIVEKSSKNREYDSEYVLRDKAKMGEQELASMFISFLKTSLPVLSGELENKQQDDIYLTMDRYFKKEMDKIVRYIKTNEEEIVSLAEVINFIVEMVSDKEISQIEILKKLGEIE